MIDINIMGALYTAHAALPHLRKTTGQYVVTGSADHKARGWDAATGSLLTEFDDDAGFTVVNGNPPVGETGNPIEWHRTDRIAYGSTVASRGILRDEVRVIGARVGVAEQTQLAVLTW